MIRVLRAGTIDMAHDSLSVYAAFAEALIRARVSAAYDDGFEAFHAGKERSDNPFGSGEQHDDWEDGWNDAERTDLWGRHAA